MSAGPLGAFPRELATADAQLDPLDWYAAVHDDTPIRWDEERGCWDVFDYDLVKAVANDPDRFSSRFDANPDYVEPEDGTIAGRSMLYQDPPRHDELRSVVDDFFRPGAVAALEPEIEAIAHQFVDAAVADGDEFDLVESFSYPLPVSVIAEMLGVPAEDRAQFRQWSTFAVAASAETGASEAAMMEMRTSLFEYFDDLVAARRDDPRDDLISRVLATEGLDREEMRGFFAILLIAGNITTTNLITNAVWSLAEADAFDLTRGDELTLERAVEEVLRYRSPVQTHTRIALVDAEVGGETIEAGDPVGVWFGAANHDPAVFDDPNEFRPNRRPNPHVAFGHGVHFCLGASLARLEARVALRVLGERFEEASVDVDALEPSGSMLVYGPRTCPVSVAER